jgi:trimeric autotransporter adhesin
LSADYTLGSGSDTTTATSVDSHQRRNTLFTCQSLSQTLSSHGQQVQLATATAGLALLLVQSLFSFNQQAAAALDAANEATDAANAATDAALAAADAADAATAAAEDASAAVAKLAKSVNTALKTSRSRSQLACSCKQAPKEVIA